MPAFFWGLWWHWGVEDWDSFVGLRPFTVLVWKKDFYQVCGLHQQAGQLRWQSELSDVLHLLISKVRRIFCYNIQLFVRLLQLFYRVSDYLFQLHCSAVRCVKFVFEGNILFWRWRLFLKVSFVFEGYVCFEGNFSFEGNICFWR